MARGVDSTAGAGSHDGRDLGDDAGGQDIAQKDVGVAGQGNDALLDTRAAGVVEADDGRAALHGQVHDLAHLLGVHLGEAAAEDGEVLGEDVYPAAVDGAPAGDHAIAQVLSLLHAEADGAVHGKHIQLAEGTGIEQFLRPLSGGHLAASVLAVNALLPAAQPGLLPHLLQLFDFVVNIHHLPLLLLISSFSLLYASPPRPINSLSNRCRPCLMRKERSFQAPTTP